MTTIFEKDIKSLKENKKECTCIDKSLLREQPLNLPQVTELEAMRHFKEL